MSDQITSPTGESTARDHRQIPAIEIRGLRKAYGRTAVLRGLDLDVRRGDTLTVLGPNGTGKTTLINILASLTRPDAGTIRVAGLDMARLGHNVRRITGVVTHEPMLYDQLTGYENLKFTAKIFGLERTEDRIAAVVESLGITARLHQRVGTLSHGMQKRFTIARALLHDPLVLLMDEPESGLDQEAVSMLEALVSTPTSPDRTVVMTTHNLERALTMGRRLAILVRGGITHQETLESGASIASVRDAYYRHTRVAS